MPSIEQARPGRLIDSVWRVMFRVAFPLARAWWTLRRPHHEGALIAIYVGQALLLLKSSYRSEWNFPGGSVHAGETPHQAALREMEEEIGLSPHGLIAAGSASGIWDGRRDTVHFFELHLDAMPALRLDNREIVAAHLASPEELQGMALTQAVAAYCFAKRNGTGQVSAM
ncbi:NUDIX hydrolase [Caballeronia novacaledonica]|uniref:NUDIX hydrolase n=1 Tax=Caballeronia novacaledonica TaxID=1544861 RepID=A0A2U3ICT2_9BURK|nr:NUDIX hydrolase [Caballeronia novacaledonica]SPB18030.1 NUDIX hydrolase [Caballeronia novacaledonica]